VRKIINSTYLTLDGVMDNIQNWPSVENEDNERRYQVQNDLLQSADALLMGRRTYEGFAPAWSSRSGDPYSDRINSMPKYVVSSTLKSPEWENTIVIDTDPIDEIRRLKEQDGGDLVQYGFGPLSFALMEHGLLDELRLWIHPFIAGQGGPDDLIYRATSAARFKLEDVTTLQSGIVILSYRYLASAGTSKDS
jgi:dihydrofolate reductase